MGEMKTLHLLKMMTLSKMTIRRSRKKRQRIMPKTSIMTIPMRRRSKRKRKKKKTKKEKKEKKDAKTPLPQWHYLEKTITPPSLVFGYGADTIWPLNCLQIGRLITAHMTGKNWMPMLLKTKEMVNHYL